MTKTIVTHASPDEDALTSIWLLHRFYPGWDKAQIAFVPAGKTLNDQPPDDHPEFIHVDTGLGKFDHHQTDEDTCAARLVFDFLQSENLIPKYHIAPLDRLIAVINDFDHFREVYLPNAASDMHDFLLVGIINGLRTTLRNDNQLVIISENILDGLLQIFVNKVYAEEAIKNGLEFRTKWGKTIAMETESRESTALAQKEGIMLVISKSKKTGQIRIKLRPDSKLDLREIYNKVKEADPKATWFYHASGHMLLNGSTKNPEMVPSLLSLNETVTIVKECHS